MTRRTRRKTLRPTREARVDPPLEEAASRQRMNALRRTQAAVVRDLIRLDLAPPRFETEGLALIRTFLAED